MQYNNIITKIENTPFYDYNNRNWNEKQLPSLIMTQDYIRHSGNPLSNFMVEKEEKIKKLILYYCQLSAMIVVGHDKIVKFKESFDAVCNEFYENFMQNKYIIDTTVDEYGNYVFDGGRTTTRYDLNTCLLITNIINKYESSKTIDFTHKISNKTTTNLRW